MRVFYTETDKVHSPEFKWLERVKYFVIFLGIHIHYHTELSQYYPFEESNYDQDKLNRIIDQIATYTEYQELHNNPSH